MNSKEVLEVWGITLNNRHAEQILEELLKAKLDLRPQLHCIVNGGWSHAVCEVCYLIEERGREPTKMTDVDSETCCYCGIDTFDRIFYRDDPAKVHPDYEETT